MSSRWVLAGLAALVAVGVVLLLLELGADPEPPDLARGRTPSTTTSAKPEPPGPAERAIRSAPSAPEPRPEVDVAPEPDPIDVDENDDGVLSPHEQSIFLAGEVPQRLMAAAARCYRGEEAGKGRRDERLEIQYELRIRSGQATVHDVAFVDSQLDNPGLEQCVIRVLQQLSWHGNRVPDMTEEMTASFTLLDLKKRARWDRPIEDNEPNEDFGPGD